MQTVLIAGITGHQGQSVYQAQKLAGNTIIGLTRNIQSKVSQSLIKNGCHLIQCDLGQPETLVNIPKHDISFLVTDFWAGKSGEIIHGCNFIDAVVSKTSHIVFSSTLSSNINNTFSHSDSKFEIETYLKSKTKFYSILRLGFLMEIFSVKDFVPPITLGMMKKNIGKGTKLPFVSVSDVGKMFNLIAANPNKFTEQELNLVSDHKTIQEVLDLFKECKGKKPFNFSLPNFIFSKFVSADLLKMWSWFSLNKIAYQSSKTFIEEARPVSFKNWLLSQN
jgi:uncharacterized protein YbjT (DUF2867 family)